MANHTRTSRSVSAKTNPVIRKLAQHDKHSIDLDRPAIEQGLGIYTSDYGGAARSPHDVNFNPSAKRGYHNRSASGASQFSTATAGSGPRNGSFVHPFQQTPRPYTPTLASAHHGLGGEYTHHDSDFVPEETETNDTHAMFSSSTNLASRPVPEHSSSASSLPALYIHTRSTPSMRLAKGSSQSNLLSARSHLSSDRSSPTDTISPISASRNSVELTGFRLRSRSDIDPPNRRDSIQEARRKFHEKEQAKAEKIAQQEVRDLERRNQKEARRAEKGARSSFASDTNRSKRSRSDPSITHEKGDSFVSRDYNAASEQPIPNTTIHHDFEVPRRSRTVSATKRRTHSAWTTFMMWLRTRLLRMSKLRRD